jgi:hypothetical protein
LVSSATLFAMKTGCPLAGFFKTNPTTRKFKAVVPVKPARLEEPARSLKSLPPG